MERIVGMKTMAALLLALVIAVSAAIAAPPEYVAKKAGCEMIMDGVLDEPAWTNSQPVGPFVFAWYESGDKEQTEAKIVWDDTRIYFAFRCDDKHIWAEHYEHGSGVYQDDCCEAFISPVPEGPERLDYINYEINCIASRLTGYHAPSRDVNKRWNECIGVEIGRVINGTCCDDSDTDTGWVLEFSIPFKHFEDFDAQFPPVNGQAIFLGLNRCGGKTNQQYSQWSPSQTPKPNFHKPEDFGKVIFSTEVVR